MERNCKTQSCSEVVETSHSDYCRNCRLTRLKLRDKFKFQARREGLPVMELVDRAMGNPQPKPQNAGVMEQIPQNAYAPPVMCWQDSWSPQTLRFRLETVDRKRA